MISDADITKLKKVFATKGEFRKLEETVGDLRIEVGDLSGKLDSFEEKMTRGFETMYKKFDTFAGEIYKLNQENSFDAGHLAHHDRQY